METLSALLAICEGNPPVDTPNEESLIRALIVCVCFNNLLSKQLSFRWCETIACHTWLQSWQLIESHDYIRKLLERPLLVIPIHAPDHDDVIIRKHFRVTGPLCGEFTSHRWIPHKGQWRGALMFPLICAWMNDWVNNREAGDLRRHCAH